jgi:hypothetical protein
MIGGNGLFVSKTTILVGILSIFVIIPTILSKVGFEENAFVAFFTNPFTAFAVIVFIGVGATFQYLRPHLISLVHLGIIMMAAFIYVWGLLI